MNKILIKLLKLFVRRFASYHDFIDPIDLMAKLTRFGQPSEVAVPTELLRAGASMHARGLLNSQAIQYNLDWIWPYWVNRQFDPTGESFVPRAFSLTHINLTHRNWTAVGLPDEEETPIVDPRGLVTPFRDGWSIDFWMNSIDEVPKTLADQGDVNQYLETEGRPSVVTEGSFEDQTLNTSVEVNKTSGPGGSASVVCSIDIQASAAVDSWFSVALRPYNPEGISTVNEIRVRPDLTGWAVESDSGRTELTFDTPPDRHLISNFDGGDVRYQFPNPSSAESLSCGLGMANSAAVYRINADQTLDLSMTIPLRHETGSVSEQNGWSSILDDSCTVDVPDDKFVELFESSKRTLLTLSGESIYPGPFTYKRFWFRDATFMIQALLVCGYHDRARDLILKYPDEQTLRGYFCSQKGEWDSNGQVLWTFEQYCRITDRDLPSELLDSARYGADWIINKRLSDSLNERHGGLLPSGFSAEHFGPNDYYYWDDFWAVAGLEATEEYLSGDTVSRYQREADALRRAINLSMQPVRGDRDDDVMPPSPYRKPDAGSIGSIVAGYPLKLFPPEDSRIIDTVDFLRREHFVNGAFFQEMIHSGLNPYLSLHIAQIYLRANNNQYWSIVQTVAEMASDTGKWPEAVHPRTGGGCMGDGEHGWAAAEWILMIKNMFILEEQDHLILGRGIPEKWVKEDETIKFGPASTRFGRVAVEFVFGEDNLQVNVDSNWHEQSPEIVVDVTGFQTVSSDTGTIENISKEKDQS